MVAIASTATLGDGRYYSSTDTASNCPACGASIGEITRIVFYEPRPYTPPAKREPAPRFTPPLVSWPAREPRVAGHARQVGKPRPAVVRRQPRMRAGLRKVGMRI